MLYGRYPFSVQANVNYLISYKKKLIRRMETEQEQNNKEELASMIRFFDNMLSKGSGVVWLTGPQIGVAKQALPKERK